MTGTGSQGAPGSAGSPAWATGLIRSATDGMFVADDHGVIFEVNDAWTRLVGFGPEGLPYQPPYPWWPDAALVNRLDELPFRHRDGVRVWVAISVTTVEDPDSGRTLLVGTVRDVTRQRDAVDLAGQLSGAVTIAEVLTGAARSLARAFDAQVFFQQDGDGEVFTAEGPVAAGQVPPPVPAELRDAGPAAEPPGAEAHGLAARIRTTGQDWRGWITFGTPRRVAADDLLLLGFLTATAGQAVEQLNAQRRMTEARSEALARFAGALSTASDRASVMNAVATLGPAVFGADATACATLGDLHDDVDVVTVGGDGVPARVALSPDDRSALVTTVRTGEPAYASAPGAVADPSAPTMVTSCLLPLHHGDRPPAGAIQVRWHHAVPLDSALSNLLDTVAGLTIQALQRAELTASAEAMAHLAARLAVTRSPAEAVQAIVEAVPPVLGARLPGVVIREDDGRISYYHTGLPDGLAASYDDLDLDDPRPVVEVLRTGRRIILADRTAFRARYPDLTDYAGRYGVVTTVALPLLDSQRRPVAALGLGWTRPRSFDAAGLARLDTIADLCEQTLERTRLVAAEHQLITRLATRLQTTATTIAEPLDIAVRYRPAMTGLNLGGDWYDLITLPGDRLAVVVGDVVGHHIEAAADMAQIRTLINALIRLGVPLTQVFQQFTALIGRGFLGTAVIIVIDPAAGTAEIARAGHPHPVLLRPGRPARQLAEHRTAPLGLITGPTVTSTVAFEPGDTLVAYTDGLIERRDQFYDDSVARFHAVMVEEAGAATAEELAEALLTAATGTDDDQALVVVRHGTTAPSRVLLRRAFTAGQLSDLRHAAREKAGEAGLDQASLEDFTIAVYELLTNAVRHGGGRGELLLQVDHTTLTCRITDIGTGSGIRQQYRGEPVPDPAASGGRGLWLARELTGTLEIVNSAEGVQVSVTMPLPSASAV